MLVTAVLLGMLAGLFMAGSAAARRTGASEIRRIRCTTSALTTCGVAHGDGRFAPKRSRAVACGLRLAAFRVPPV
jgi:hypothetical protein